MYINMELQALTILCISFVVSCVLRYVQSQESCPMGVTTDTSQLLVSGGYCFHFVPEAVTRQNAQSACTTRNGSLATIRDNATQSALFRHGSALTEVVDTTRYWIGGSLNTDASVLWDNGENIPFTHLEENTRYSSSSTNCLLLQLDDGIGRWTTADCNRGLWFYGYICQYKKTTNGIVSRNRGNTGTRLQIGLGTIAGTVLMWFMKIHE